MKIALIGYGKMGRTIEQLALEKNHQVVLKIDLHNTDNLTVDNLRQADVAIEFTGPSSAAGNLMICARAGVPVVCGSTGWLESLSDVKKMFESTGTAFLYASNFSIGVNIFFELNKKLAALMALHPEYGVELKEIHHTGKKDAPSGTAITLAEEVMAAMPFFTGWVNHKTNAKNELTILSERTDPAPGTHLVSYHSAIDNIDIIHTAHNRQGFASGALMAAEFILGKTGFFSMNNVLGF